MNRRWLYGIFLPRLVAGRTRLDMSGSLSSIASLALE